MKLKVLKTVAAIVILLICSGIGYSVTPFSYMDYVSVKAVTGEEGTAGNKSLEIEQAVLRLLNQMREDYGYGNLITTAKSRDYAAQGMADIENKCKNVKIEFSGKFKNASLITGEFYGNAYQIVNSVKNYASSSKYLMSEKDVYFGICIEPNGEYTGFYRFVVFLAK